MTRFRMTGVAVVIATLVVTMVGGPPARAAAAQSTEAYIKTWVYARDTGLPMKGVCVIAVPARGTFSFPDGCRPKSTGLGRVNVPVAAPGSYNLFAFVPPSTMYGSQWVGPSGGTGTQQSARLITASVPGETKTAPTIFIDRRGSIRGKLPAPEEIPPPGQGGTVGIVAPEPENRWQPYASGIASDGSFSILWLGPYEWPLLFRIPGHADQWSGGGGNRLRADLIQAAVPGNSPIIDFTVKRGVSAIVNFPDPPAGSDNRVVLRNVTTGESVGVGSLGSGSKVRIRVVLGQQVKIQCLCGGTTSWHGGTDFDSATPVVITGGGPTEVTFLPPQ
ncbi:hypothetical protein O7543_04410 [Solwaraspora sp. WMMA2080]|uniref:hypothetical protein n=1 Tax=unclassified Solwaraspora TaxID=2627926 RepID=UPI00248C965D|nr:MULTISPECIES: hypothetical protein [unclassified Solwaraspora]WBB99725.1 hypothetical protein O7553_12960 [Solwaraspora sp. WMMA2059]WBC21725.1 hypothetical protein O7543_04410 [Solwaraspora sp. WMMA2080]